MNSSTAISRTETTTVDGARRVRRLAGLAIMGVTLSAALLQTGCVAVVAGAGAGAAVAYVRGDLDATLNANFDKAVKAANAALADLKFAKVSENKDALQAIFIARNAADKRIEIRVEKVGDSVAKVKIRVGVFGDEALSLAILERVKANL